MRLPFSTSPGPVKPRRQVPTVVAIGDGRRDLAPNGVLGVQEQGLDRRRARPDQAVTGPREFEFRVSFGEIEARQVGDGLFVRPDVRAVVVVRVDGHSDADGFGELPLALGVVVSGALGDLDHDVAAARRRELVEHGIDHAHLVPLQEGRITDDGRIRAALPTIAMADVAADIIALRSVRVDLDRAMRNGGFDQQFVDHIAAKEQDLRPVWTQLLERVQALAEVAHVMDSAAVELRLIDEYEKAAVADSKN